MAVNSVSTIQKALAKLEKNIGATPPATGSSEVFKDRDDVHAADDSDHRRMRADWLAAQDAPEMPRLEKEQDQIHRLALDRLRQLGILTPDAKRSQLAEEYRLIKRPLLINVDKKGADIVENANLIMVTSALPGEGKTFTAINLAMSIAMEQDRTVLLVDGDVAKPTAAKRLGIESDTGLIDLLAGSHLSIADVLVRTDVPNMRIMPAGRKHERATELLASERMLAIMEELSSRYRDRIVIFDSPPLLLSSESAALAEMMGQIILVVAAEQTVQHATADALSRLGQDKIKGLVLNKYRPSIGNRYGTGYGYGYGYGYGEQPADADTRRTG
jgi:exopolysaccharide/PEP-CTERM locus tyrosine autokinase